MAAGDDEADCAAAANRLLYDDLKELSTSLQKVKDFWQLLRRGGGTKRDCHEVPQVCCTPSPSFAI